MPPVHSRRALEQILGRLACPECHSALGLADEDVLRCRSAEAHEFRVIGGVPILLPDDASFRTADVVAASGSTYFARRSREMPLKARLRQSLPSPGLELGVPAVDRLVCDNLPPGPGPRTGLMIGAGTHAEDVGRRIPGIEWLITDVDLAFGVDAVADVLSLPVPDASLDLVVVEHVLEHVVDPVAAGREIERVLRVGGIVLAKVPFSFPWHGGYVDFFRCTPAGLRAVFGGTDVLHVAPSMGPASAVAYAGQAVMSVRARRRPARIAALVAGRVVLAPLKHLDRVLISMPDAAIASAAIAYVGRRTEGRRSRAELVDDARAIGRGELGGAGPATWRRPTWGRRPGSPRGARAGPPPPA